MEGGPNGQGLKGVIADNQGGAIVFWDSTSAFNCRAYADRLGSNGDLLWASPAPVCTLLSDERFLWCVDTDGRGGAS